MGSPDAGAIVNPEYHKRWILEGQQDPSSFAINLRVLDKLQAEKVVGQARISMDAIQNLNLEPAEIVKLILKMLDDGLTLTGTINILVDERAPWRTMKPEDMKVDVIFKELKKGVEDDELKRQKSTAGNKKTDNSSK